jgi:hypothetical protein
LWVAERRAHNEAVPDDSGALLTQIELGDAVLRA